LTIFVQPFCIHPSEIVTDLQYRRLTLFHNPLSALVHGIICLYQYLLYRKGKLCWVTVTKNGFTFLHGFVIVRPLKQWKNRTRGSHGVLVFTGEAYFMSTCDSTMQGIIEYKIESVTLNEYALFFSRSEDW